MLKFTTYPGLTFQLLEVCREMREKFFYANGKMDQKVGFAAQLHTYRNIALYLNRFRPEITELFYL